MGLAAVMTDKFGFAYEMIVSFIFDVGQFRSASALTAILVYEHFNNYIAAVVAFSPEPTVTIAIAVLFVDGYALKTLHCSFQIVKRSEH